MIVDAHVHLFPDRLIEAIRAWFDRNAWHIIHRHTAEDCIAELTAGGIDRMVALPYAHKPGMAEALNAFTADLARRHPQVAPCCTVFPGEDGEERLLDQALFGPFVGVKIHSHVMKIAPDDRRLDPVWRASARHRKPVVIHCGKEPSLEGYGVDTHAVSGAERLRRALDRHPDAIAVVPHLGADEYREMEALLDVFPHLYLDTSMAISGHFSPQPDLEMIRRHPDRILYGTDYPNLPYEWRHEWKVIEALQLPDETWRKVMGGNAARVFGLG